MHTQHVAMRSSSAMPNDAGESQPRASISVSYQSGRFSDSFPVDCTQAINPQNARRRRLDGDISRVEKRDRRLTCLRASRAFVPYPCLPLWQHVAQSRRVPSKSSWSSTPCPLQYNQPSRASITNSRSGQAAPPVSALHHGPEQEAV